MASGAGLRPRLSHLPGLGDVAFFYFFIFCVGLLKPDWIYNWCVCVYYSYLFF